jgi:hypothetical protein
MSSKLDLLIGQKINKVNTGFSSVYALDAEIANDLSSSMIVHTQIFFQIYQLNIFNDHELVSSYGNSMENDIGQSVISIEESEKEALILLENGDFIKIHLSDEAFNEPEAMCLYGPDNLIVIWN